MNPTFPIRQPDNLNMAGRTDLKVIVMPPAHGKSYYIKKYPKFSASDEVYSFRDSAELMDLRRKAKRGEITWEGFDKGYAAILRERCKTRFIFVPAIDLGNELGEIHSVFVLPLYICEENIAERGRDYSRYMHCYNVAKMHPKAQFVGSMEELETKIAHLHAKTEDDHQVAEGQNI